jgi:hypothetical protein
MRHVDQKSPCCLPAASLRTTDRLPAAQIRLREDKYLICRVLWPIRRPLFGVESCFLPALREGRSGGQALGAYRDVVEGEGHRDAGVKAYQADHVGDADMVERLRFGDGAPACLIRRATRRAIRRSLRTIRKFRFILAGI